MINTVLLSLTKKGAYFFILACMSVIFLNTNEVLLVYLTSPHYDQINVTSYGVNFCPPEIMVESVLNVLLKSLPQPRY